MFSRAEKKPKRTGGGGPAAPRSKVPSLSLSVGLLALLYTLWLHSQLVLFAAHVREEAAGLFWSPHHVRPAWLHSSNLEGAHGVIKGVNTTNNRIRYHMDDQSDGMSACLLIKDDNHRLVEWLAYHYHTLPLRHLIVAVDPESKTSPLSILRRWNNSEMNMDILLWNDTDYMPESHIEEREQKLQSYLDKYGDPFKLEYGIENWKKFRRLHRCCLHHKAMNRSWVALIDSDEYVLFNPIHDDDPQVDLEGRKQQSRRTPTTALRDRLPAISEKTILELIKEETVDGPWINASCLAMVRLFFGAIEADEVELSNAGDIFDFDPNKFDTLSFFRHDRKGAFGFNRWAKALVDVSRLPTPSMRKWRVKSIHNPFPHGCTSTNTTEYNDSVLRVHHYLGSWESYSSRRDMRRNRTIFDEQSKVNHGPTYDIQPWLESFIRTEGRKRASELLQGVGETSL